LIQNNVPVNSRLRRKTGVKVFRNRLHPQDIDIVREVAVDAEQPRTLSSLHVRIEMTNLAGGVYARIGAARADTCDRFVRNPGYCIIQARLNTGRMGLDLPTVIVCPVVFQAESQAVQVVCPGRFLASFYSWFQPRSVNNC